MWPRALAAPSRRRRSGKSLSHKVPTGSIGGNGGWFSRFSPRWLCSHRGPSAGKITVTARHR